MHRNHLQGREHMNEPIFLGGTSRSGAGDIPIKYEAGQTQPLANCTKFGLLSSIHRMTTDGIRKKMAIQNVEISGYGITYKLMGHGVRSKALICRLAAVLLILSGSLMGSLGWVLHGLRRAAASAGFPPLDRVLLPLASTASSSSSPATSSSPWDWAGRSRAG
jgi:hypothetical protein